MTSNNETVSRQMPWAGNIAKAMTSNGKQFTSTREMLTAVACDGWNLSVVFKFCFCFVLLYNKSLVMTGPLGNSEFCFPQISIMSRETLRFSGNKIHCSPLDQSLSVYCELQPSLTALSSSLPPPPPPPHPYKNLSFHSWVPLTNLTCETPLPLGNSKNPSQESITCPP